jgi:hypothetical protein
MAAKSRKAANNATFHAYSCQILLLSSKILTRFPRSQPLPLGAIACAAAELKNATFV